MLKPRETIRGVVSVRKSLTGSVNARRTLEGTVVAGGKKPPTYDGSYYVLPSFDSQTLETNGLLMNDDVTVDAIYVSRTSNPSGGITVYIGGTE